jgi:hypothetical protein
MARRIGHLLNLLGDPKIRGEILLLHEQNCSDQGKRLKRSKG